MVPHSLYCLHSFFFYTSSMILTKYYKCRFQAWNQVLVCQTDITITVISYLACKNRWPWVKMAFIICLISNPCWSFLPKKKINNVGQPKYMRTSLKVDVWAGTQSRRHTTIHECNKSARLFQETRADKQCLSSTIRGRKSAALFAHSSTVTNGIVPNFCSHACHIFQHAPSPPESLSCTFHVLCFLSPAETARGTPWRLSTEGNPRGLSLLPSSVLKTFFFSFPKH